MSISKYQHLKEVRIEEDPTRPRSQPPKTPSRARPLKTWKTSRRRDEKIFLAREIKDISAISDEIKESLLRLLNHPNVVNLIDIVSESADGGYDFTVWEYCDRGSLSHLLDSYKALGSRGRIIPEKLCWSVLSGVCTALRYLHNGANQPFGSIKGKRQELDWQPILMVDINPTNIFFASSNKNIEEQQSGYGDVVVKLGCFGSAVVASRTDEGETPVWIRSSYSPYMPPEIYNRPHAPWSTKADIWALGAVLYTMMAGTPPRPRNIHIVPGMHPDDYNDDDGRTAAAADRYLVTKLPRSYSLELREIVYAMMQLDPKRRLSADEVGMRVGFHVGRVDDDGGGEDEWDGVDDG